MDYQIKSVKKLSYGFSLVEVIIVLGIFSILISVSVSVYNSFKTHENLEITTTGVVEGIRHAQANSQSGKGDSMWGVEILTTSITIFKGGSYTGRDTSADQSFNFSAAVTASGLSEIIFTKITGSTSNIGTIVITNSFGAKNISINAKGNITY